MKRIVFDIDNTLLMFNEDYIKEYAKLLDKLGYGYDLDRAYDIYDVIGEYEKDGYILEDKHLLSYINDKLNTNYDMRLIKELNYHIANYWTDPVSDEVKDTLDYLSHKYELYVLTNYYTDVQAKRLEVVGIKKYFNKIIGGDLVKIKPHPEAYYKASEELDIKDCLMIGDRLPYDYEGALKVGMPAILYDYEHQYDSNKYNKIDEFKELKERL